MRSRFPAALLAFTLTLPALAVQRHALVIGNAGYTGEGMEVLTTPANDAEAIAARLATMGFANATALIDLDEQHLRDAITDFVNSLAEGDTALFYYSGHGIQFNGVNFLWPIDEVVIDQAHVEEHFVSVQTVFDGMKAAKTSVNIIILDACRDNPFSSDSFIPGLALPRGTPNSAFIAYATKENEIALDIPVGPRSNSPYTHALLSQMGRTGVPISEIFGDVRNMVAAVTAQIPVVENTLNQVFYFRPPVVINARIEIADDEAIIAVDGVERISYRFNGGNIRPITLHGGDNDIAVKVYNHRSFTGGLPFFGGQQPEGWNYKAFFTRPDGTLLLPELSAGEDTVEKDGPRHGRLFTATTFTIHVDDESGAMFVTNEDRQAFTREGLADPSIPAGILTDAVVADLNFAARDHGNPDCPEQYFPHLDCLIMGANRSCLIARAVVLARSGSCDAAFQLALTTQCHSDSAQNQMRHAGSAAVCAWLSQQ